MGIVAFYRPISNKLATIGFHCCVTYNPKLCWPRRRAIPQVPARNKYLRPNRKAGVRLTYLVRFEISGSVGTVKRAMQSSGPRRIVINKSATAEIYRVGRGMVAKRSFVSSMLGKRCCLKRNDAQEEKHAGAILRPWPSIHRCVLWLLG